MRTLGIIIVLALWILMGWKMCTDYSECCSDSAASQIETSTSAVIPASSNCEKGIICFEDNSCEALFGNRFDTYKDSLLALLTPNRQLRITGIYDTSESYEGSAANLGACRAQSIRSAFSNIEDSKIRTGGQIMVGRDMTRTDRYLIEIIDGPSSSAQTDSDEVASSSDDSSQSPSGASSPGAQAVIYFPFNSTDKLDDSTIESYLTQVANQIKGTGQKVRLTGHTDDIGGAASNMILGQRRANIIADYLMGQGVFRSQIVSESRGETSPVASNSTEEGRSRNRRTELQIIK